MSNKPSDQENSYLPLPKTKEQAQSFLKEAIDVAAMKGVYVQDLVARPPDTFDVLLLNRILKTAQDIHQHIQANKPVIEIPKEPT